MRNHVYPLFAALLVIVVCFNVSKAQQDPQYSHYMFNKFDYNPGVAGTNNKTCANFLVRTQWTGFEGQTDDVAAPNTQFFNIHTSLNNEYVHGVGLDLYNDQQGFENTISLKGAASHILDLPFAKLGLGLNVGFIQKSLNGEKLKAFDDGDPLIPDGEVSNFIFDVGIGGYLYADKYYGGISVQHIPQGDLGYTTDGDGKYQRTYYFTGGYHYQLTPDWTISPSALVKTDITKTQFDINALAKLQETYWGGLGYRGGDAITLMLGMNLTPDLKLSYSYDIATQGKGSFSDGANVKQGGSHEFFIRYCFKLNLGKKDEYESPIWTPRFL